MGNLEKIHKKLSASLEAKLNKMYAPSSRIDDVFRGNAITIVTNEQGEAMHLYIGERNLNGSISGIHYARQVKLRADNKIVKSHWDNKGKVSGKG